MLKFLLVLLVLVSSCAGAFVGRNINYVKHKHDFPFQDLNNQRIVGGRTVDITMHPHQISLRLKPPLCKYCIREHHCGGSIISSTIIVTAAHCVFKRRPSEFHVMAGSNQREGSDGVIERVQEIIMHEDYHWGKKTNDIALLILANPLPLNNSTIKPIHLADGFAKEGEIATVTGWGITDTRLGLPADLLQEVKVPIISNELCNKDYNRRGFITDDMMCAGFRGVGGKDACNSDSGGPLSINGKLAGIVSWGPEYCGSPKYPGVYARISYLRPWLWQKIAQLEWSAFVGRHIYHVKHQVDFPAQNFYNERIIGGRTVDITMHPHQISLRLKPPLCKYCIREHHCGGSIISSTMIVTAAHCVHELSPSLFHVMAGSNQREGSDGVIGLVQKIIVHEDFQPVINTNDIALLILANPLPLNNSTIKPIDLADGVAKEGEIATVTGWGITDTRLGLPADLLQEVKVPIISNELCNKDYKPTDTFITDDMMCAGFRGVGGKDACMKDSGGPLSIKGKLAGIVSWGGNCGSPIYPGVYARISYLRPWLLQKIAQFQCSVRLLHY